VINLVLRVAMHLRRTGRTGLIGVTGRLGPAEVLAGGAEVLAIALGVAAPIQELGGELGPVEAFDIAVLRWVGAPIGLAAVLGVAFSQQTMGRSWRIGVDQDERTGLVTGGPYRHVRHPIYSCLFLVHLGVALLVPNTLALASVALALVSVELQARAVEEPWLLREHGERYAAYGAQTGRFVPGVGRLRVPDGVRGS
jgi:protein-S-isoprenylcysteine O-methyltransferase Ste14